MGCAVVALAESGSASGGKVGVASVIRVRFGVTVRHREVRREAKEARHTLLPIRQIQRANYTRAP